jgi:hypothetical protein
VRKGQKEALKASGRHDSMSHPTSKFYGGPYHGSIHPHKISDRYNSTNPFKNAVTELVSC